MEKPGERFRAFSRAFR